MISFMVLMEVCEEPDILRLILLFRKLLNVVCIVVPIILIVLLTIDISKNVISADEGVREKNVNMFMKRILACILMFLVPRSINFFSSVLSGVISDFDVGYQSCYQNSDRVDYFDTLRKVKEAEEKRRKEEALAKKKYEYEASKSFSKMEITFLTGKLTLNYDDLTEISNATLADLERAMRNNENNKYGEEGEKGMAFLPYAAKYLELEKEHGVNVFFVLGVHAHESGWLDSRATRECNNIGGVKFSNQTGATRCIETSEYAQEGSYYAGWGSIEEFLEYFFPWVKKEYLSEGGDHYYGTSIEAFNTDYNGLPSWIEGVKATSDSFFNAANEE